MSLDIIATLPWFLQAQTRWKVNLESRNKQFSFRGIEACSLRTAAAICCVFFQQVLSPSSFDIRLRFLVHFRRSLKIHSYIKCDLLTFKLVFRWLVLIQHCLLLLKAFCSDKTLPFPEGSFFWSASVRYHIFPMLPTKKITESQHGRGWQGPLWVTQPNPLPKQGHPEQAAQDLVQVRLEYLQRRRLHSLPGQPGPGLCHTVPTCIKKRLFLDSYFWTKKQRFSSIEKM